MEPEKTFTPPFNVEMKEVGCWFDIESGIDTLKLALQYASDYSNIFGTEDRVRIIDNDGKII